MRYRFTKTNRILKAREFRRIKKVGCRKVSPHFILYYLNETTPYSRLGITVSKKYGSSVIRNYQKRIIREYFRLNQNLLCTCNYSIIVKKNFYNTKTIEIQNELDEIFY